jgi:flagellar basal body-associated protein FliL
MVTDTEKKERIITIKPEILRIIILVLLLIAAAMIVLLIIGTIYGIARSSDEPVIRFGRTTGAEQAARMPSGTNGAMQGIADIRVFSGLGRLRIPLSNSSIMILSVAFPYYANDLAFTEELAAKIDEFRSIASDYFSSLPAEKLADIDEEAAKNEILRQYNAILRLGRIEALYFSDMIILDTNP